MRDLPTEMLTALDTGKVEPFMAIEINYTDAPSETVRLCSRPYSLTFGGHTWAAAGALMNISKITETSELKAEKLAITLSGIPSDVVSHTTTSSWQGRPLKIYFGLLIGAAKTPFIKSIAGGRLDNMSIRYSAGSKGKGKPQGAIITVSSESPLIDMDTPRDRYYTAEYQRSKFPNDSGLDFVPALQARDFNW